MGMARRCRHIRGCCFGCVARVYGVNCRSMTVYMYHVLDVTCVSCDEIGVRMLQCSHMHILLLLSKWPSADPIKYTINRSMCKSLHTHAKHTHARTHTEALNKTCIQLYGSRIFGQKYTAQIKHVYYCVHMHSHIHFSLVLSCSLLSKIRSLHKIETDGQNRVYLGLPAPITFISSKLSFECLLVCKKGMSLRLSWAEENCENDSRPKRK